MSGSSCRVLLDENIPTTVLWWCISQGFDVMTAREAGLVGRSDSELNAFLHRQGRVLITLDLDFSDPVKLPVGPGRIVLRPWITDGELMVQLLRKVMPLGLPRAGELLVVQAGGVARYGAAA
ncbi:MAG: hypothetical protein C4327_13635 [Meiothermus sp.]